MIEDRKPCPFCGYWTVVDTNEENIFWVLCASDTCIACGPIKNSEKDAVEAWNKRI